jgi:non-ribosomal peptide synthetase component E (peptide arylation enzyme)
MNKHASIYVDGVPRHTPELMAEYTNAGFWGPDTIGSRFREAAAGSSGRTAVVDGKKRLTYAELADEVSTVRDGLKALGVTYRDRVTVQLPNWWEQVAFLFAIAELGAVMVPATIRARGDLEYVLQYSGSKVVVIPHQFHGFSHVGLIEEMRGRLPALGSVVVVRGQAGKRSLSYEMLTEKGAIHGAGESSPVSSNDPWQIMFTSGTTSAPKGVIRTHNNTLYTLRNLQHFYRLYEGDGTDVALGILPISFIFAQYLCALGALLTGGALVLQESFNASRAVDLMEKERVTYAAMVPSMVPDFQQVRGMDSRDFSSLRMLSPAGEAVTRERKEQLHEVFKCDIRESYGLAEMTWPLGQRPDAPTEAKYSTTGQASPGAELRIVDDVGGDVPVGQPGELYLKGPTLFPGYYKNPDATKAAIDQEGWFHTGDLVIRDNAGFYAISGRKKDLIKRAGMPIIPQELEDALLRHPDVVGAAVLGLPDERRGEIACACVVLEPGSKSTPNDLLRFLDGQLATYKMPERIEIMESLPLSPNGKVLKSELKARLTKVKTPE